MNVRRLASRASGLLSRSTLLLVSQELRIFFILAARIGRPPPGRFWLPVLAGSLKALVAQKLLVFAVFPWEILWFNAAIGRWISRALSRWR